MSPRLARDTVKTARLMPKNNDLPIEVVSDWNWLGCRPGADFRQQRSDEVAMTRCRRDDEDSSR